MKRIPLKKNRVLLIVTVLFLTFPSLSRGELFRAISGRVTAEDTGKGLEGVRVLATGAIREETLTDKYGHYFFKNMPAGEYWLRFGRGNSLYLKSSPYKKVLLPGGENVSDVNYVLPLGGGISGIVKDRDGVPIAGARISIYDVHHRESDFSSSDHKITDREGRYLLQGLRESDEVIVSVSFGGRVVLRQKTEIKKGRITENIDFIVEAEGE